MVLGAHISEREIQIIEVLSATGVWGGARWSHKKRPKGGPERPKLRAEWNSRPAGILSEAKPTVMAMHGLSADSIRRRKSRTDEQHQTFAHGNRCMDLFLAMPNHSVLAPSL